MFSKDGRQADATYFSNRWSSSQHSTFSFFSKWGFVFQGPVTYFQLTHTQELTTTLKFLPKIKTNIWSYFSFALRKVWCEKLLQSSSFIYRKKRRVKNRTKQGMNLYFTVYTYTFSSKTFYNWSWNVYSSMFHLLLLDLHFFQNTDDDF